MVVVKTMHIEFQTPAEFDEELILETRLTHSYRARIHHDYRILRHDSPSLSSEQKRVVTGHSVIACVDRQGAVRRLPKFLQLFKGASE